MMRLTGQRQRGSWVRLASACGLALLVAVVVGATAAAARPGLDRTFGQGGRASLGLSLPPGASKFEGVERASAPDGSTYVLALVGPDRRQFLYRFWPTGRLDRRFGGSHHAVRLPVQPRWGYELAVDARSRPVVMSGDQGPRLTRYTRAGHLDRGFGHEGTAVVKTLPTEFPGFETLPGGRGFLVYTEGQEGRGYTTWDLAELTADGRPAKRFGGDGETSVEAAGNLGLEPVASRRGAVFIGGYSFNGAPRLTRVSSNGRLDTRFNRASRRSLRPFNRLGLGSFDFEPTTVLALDDGGVEVLGWAGTKGFEVRLRADGGPAPGFAEGYRLAPFWASGAMSLAGGAVLAYGEEHHQVTLFVLRGDGALDRRFRPARLPHGASVAGLAAVDPDLAQLSWSSGGRCDSCSGRYISRYVLPAGEEPAR
jgi:hypothetical protein